MSTIDVPFPMQGSTLLFGEDVFYRLLADVMGQGVVGATDLQVLQNPAGANRSVSVDVGSAYVAVSGGGVRRVRVPAQTNSGVPGAPTTPAWLNTFGVPDGTNPRVDRVVLTVRDSAIDASGSYDAVLRVIPGTATSGATLANLTNAAAVPSSSLLLANVLVRAATTSILTADIDTTVRTLARVGSGNAIGGGWRQIAAGVLSGGVVDFSSIPTTWNHLRVVGKLNGVTGGANSYMGIRVNGDSTIANYSSVLQGVINAAYVQNTQNASLGYILAGVAFNGDPSSFVADFPWCNVGLGAYPNRRMLSTWEGYDSGASKVASGTAAGYFSGASGTINRLTVMPSAFSFGGSPTVTLYGSM